MRFTKSTIVSDSSSLGLQQNLIRQAQAVRFQGKAHHNLAWLLGGHGISQNVRVGHQFQHQLAPAVLDLALGGVFRAVVSHGGAMHQGICTREAFHDCPVHFAGTANAVDRGAAREFCFHGARHHLYGISVGEEHGGESHRRLAAAPVRDVADGVDGLFGAARRNEDGASVSWEGGVV